MPLIETQNLSKIYQDDGTQTVGLKEATLTIENGDFVAIVGPSGSGKSTLLQVLGCLDRPTGGRYFLDGRELSQYSDDELADVRNKTIGFVFQAFNLLPRQTVLENVKLPLAYAGLSEKNRVERAHQMVNLVGLSDRIDFPTSKLSGGQKQRVAIARALANNPKIIFADEPTGSLDSKSGEVILDFLQKLNDQGHTIVLVTHESYVAESAKRIISLRDGRIEQDQLVANRRIVASQGFTK